MTKVLNRQQYDKNNDNNNNNNEPMIIQPLVRINNRKLAKVSHLLVRYTTVFVPVYTG